jgi:hypothetical protein
VPQTLGRVPGVETAVAGDTAEDVDFTHQMKHGMPFVIAFVLAFAFLVLLAAFRSLVVPVKAIVLNLLSVGAAYGVLVLVFQHHWAEPLLGFKSDGAIISWLPGFLFVLLFGLSMDYHVFILSRVREAVDAGATTDDAVRFGITVTAGVVTSAALGDGRVFSIFGTLSSLEIKQAGVGLAAAVLIDATIVRAVLLPPSMKLLGEWNWYLPRSLERLPKARIEAADRAQLALAMFSDSFASLTNRPGLRAAADHVNRPVERGDAEAVPRRAEVGRRLQRRLPTSYAYTLRTVPPGASPPTETIVLRTVAAPVPPRATGTGVLAAPAAVARRPRLDEAEVRLQAGHATATA